MGDDFPIFRCLRNGKEENVYRCHGFLGFGFGFLNVYLKLNPCVELKFGLDVSHVGSFFFHYVGIVPSDK